MSYDNTLKYLVGLYPEDFATWLLPDKSIQNLRILKTELSVDPIRADAVVFLQGDGIILHLEFQTNPESNPPLPLRMLDYWVRLQRLYNCDIHQVVVFLKPTNSRLAYTNSYNTTTTNHVYNVVRIWECEPESFFQPPGLLPLAALAKTNEPSSLLRKVAQEIDNIEDRESQQTITACTEILAGLKFEKDLLRSIFREDIMEESVIYQDILQKGLDKGVKQGVQQVIDSEISLVWRQIKRRIGTIEEQWRTQLQQLNFTQLEDLGEALLDFHSEADLQQWLETHKS